MFLGVGWGGVITFTYLRTPMMLRHGTFTCTCAHTSCYVEDVSRHAGVGWGGVVITFTYLRTPMMLRHGTFTCTCAHTWCYVEDVSRHAGVGWGNNVGVLAHSHDVTPRQVHLHVRTYVMLRWRCVTSRRGGVGWGNNVHVLASVPNQLTSCPENEEKLNDLIWAASKTSIKGFSIRVHVGNLPRKQNLHARKPCESSAKGVRQGHAAKAAAKADD